MLVPLAEATDAPRFGGKAASLATALSAGLPVPPGFALDVDATERLAHDPALAARALVECPGASGPERWAVRSSAVGEDGAAASFAGQHLTRLGVRGIPALVRAIGEVHASASSPAALAYRRRSGIHAPPRMAIVLHRLIAADVAGVLFTQNPVTGSDERFIEASWGLGEVVVSSAVSPDRVRLSPKGVVLERTIGDKELRLEVSGDAPREVETTPVERARPCLGDEQLHELHALACRVDTVWAGPHDIEFAFRGPELFLLQRRPLTGPAR
jgi:pyruvate, water dikinase